MDRGSAKGSRLLAASTHALQELATSYTKVVGKTYHLLGA